MELTVHILKTKEGKTIADVIDVDSCLPHCFFISTFLRSSYRSFSSMKTFAYQAIFFLRYFEKNNIDIVDRVRSQKYFTFSECQEFSNHCKYKIQRSKNTQDKVINLHDYTEKTLINMLYSTAITKDLVSATTNKIRQLAFKEYVKYLFRVFHANNELSLISVKKFELVIQNLEYLINLVKEENTQVKDPLQQSIPDRTYFKILELITPSCTENPFSKKVRLRNQLIIQIFNETGIRVGALAKLKISDIRRSGSESYLVITRTPNDKTDPRKNPAAQKTKAHVSALTQKTASMLLLYIETDRAEFADSMTHDFIFVSAKGITKGHPIAKSTISDFINILSSEVNFKLSPHLFRHKWNEVFEDKAQFLGYSPEQIDDMRKYACGWSENSKMVKTYNEFRNAVRSLEMSKIRQTEFTPHIDNLSY